MLLMYRLCMNISHARFNAVEPKNNQIKLVCTPLHYMVNWVVANFDKRISPISFINLI